MALVTRGTKTVGGGTNFASGTILASEVNTDFNNIYGEFNGNVQDANIKAGAGIETSKVDGFSDSPTERNTQTSPGVTGAESDATTLAEELARIRYKLHEIGLGIDTKRLTGGVNLVSWIDTPQTGPNLIRNGNFAIKTTAAGSAPDGWAIVGTPTTLTTTTAGITEGPTNMRAIRIVASANNVAEGISQTLKGLKASTKYIVGCRMRVNNATHKAELVTTGASGATFGNLALQATGDTDFHTFAGVILTDGTPTDIVVKLLTTVDATAADSFDVTHCWVRECAQSKLPLSNTPWAYNEVTAPTVLALNAPLTDTTLTCNVVCPGPGYTIELEAALMLADAGAANYVGCMAELRENGVAVQSSSCMVTQGSTQGYATLRFSYRMLAPVPGTTYTYTIFAAGLGSAIAMNHVASAAGETVLASWVRCRAVLESGGW